MKKIIFLTLLINSTLIYSQCESSRKLLNNELSPYISDGQYRNAELEAGESHTFQVTFCRNNSYKLVLGNDEGLGNIQFKIFDMSKKLLFDSKTKNYPTSWQLKFQNTSTFLIEINHKESKKSGCALLLIGFDN